MTFALLPERFPMGKHGKLLRQYGNRHLKFNPLGAASLCTAGDVQVPTLTPTGLFNHWQLGRGHNMTSLASSLFQSNDTTTAHEVAQRSGDSEFTTTPHPEPHASGAILQRRHDDGPFSPSKASPMSSSRILWKGFSDHGSPPLCRPYF